MPPVHRYNHGVVTVPNDMADAVAFAMDGYWDGEMTWCGGADEVEMFGQPTVDAMNYIRARRRSDRFRWIRVDAHALSLVRNLLDLECLNGDTECEYMIEHEGAVPDEDGYCLECHYCRCIVLRDRIDWWFDRQGFGRPAYLYPIGYDAEAKWAEVWSPQQFREAA